MSQHPFEEFLHQFIPKAATLQRRLYQLLWILETTGSEDAAQLKAELDAEYKLLFHDPKIYAQLLEWGKEDSIQDSHLLRQLKLLTLEFKKNQLPEALLKELSEKEAQLALAYAQFRPICGGKAITENEIRAQMKSETDPAKRKEVWGISKQIGAHLAPRILEIVRLRNEGAKQLGYPDYFQMQLEMQEVDPVWLLKTFEDLAEKSDTAYSKVIEEIEDTQMSKFGVAREELGPWAWNEPFGQEDPLENPALDKLVEEIDIVETSRAFFSRMGFPVEEVLAKSDMFEREGKNQHAFCINIDRSLDIRTLNNVKPTIKWLETVLHELGHAIYELGYDTSLPWLLREPPHMLTTEAMALLAGRRAYLSRYLKRLIPAAAPHTELLAATEKGLARRQLIFSRWVMVMTAFESALYRDPCQDLNALWWSLVAKFQKIRPPVNRVGCCDWASKFHLGLAPVYYFSYLLGEMFASALQEKMPGGCLDSPEAGAYLKERLFRPGGSLAWPLLVEHAIGSPLSSTPWLKEFA